MIKEQSKLRRGIRFQGRAEDGERQVARHPLLSSWNDQALFASERATLINQFSNQQYNTPPVPRDFSSSFFASRNIKNTPLYASTHAKPYAISARTNYFHIYPSAVETKQQTQPDDYGNTNGIEGGNGGRNDEGCRCLCSSCKIPVEPLCRRFAKDNIMRFCDQATMTPKYDHASCGPCKPLPPSEKTSDVSLSTTELSVKQEKAQMQQTCAPPILKRTFIVRRDPCCGELCCEPVVSDVPPCPDEVECKQPEDDPCFCSRKTKNDTCAYSKSTHEKKSKQDCLCQKEIDKFRRKKKSKVKCECPKVEKCDESCDQPIRNFCNVDKHTCYDLCKQKKVHIRCSSRTSLPNERREMDGASKVQRNLSPQCGIPYSHRHSSKYHSHCRESVGTERRDYELKRLVASPPVLMKSLTERSRMNSKPGSPCRICLPKRVLTSDQDIESFLGKVKVRSRSKSPYTEYKRRILSPFS